MKLFILLATLLSLSAQAKLVDKILAVVDGQIFSLSQVERMQQSVAPRKLISPMIYNQSQYTQAKLVELYINGIIVRKKLQEMGYIINDEQVEDQIKSTEQRLGLTRDSLNQFLKSNNLTFEEYFELTRESIEYNIFLDRIISPLVSITEQEIKNEFYKENAAKNKRLEFKYTLVDFSLPESSIASDKIPELAKMLEIYRINGTLPREISNSLSTNTFGDITEDGLRADLRTLLSQTEEGTFSKPINIDKDVHVFFVKEKNLVESEIYIKQKTRIQQKLQRSSIDKMILLWFERNKDKHYIKYFNK